MHDMAPQANPPDYKRLPEDEIVGITAILLTCSYNEKVNALGN